MTPSPAAPTEPPPARRALYYALIVLLDLGFLLALEVGYRLRHAIPFFGGTVQYAELADEGVAAAPDFDAKLTRYDHPDFTPHHILGLFEKSSDPVLFYEPRPGAKQGLYEINSAGFRDREFPEAKPAGVFRIVLLGDSIAWGHGLPLEQSLAKVLEGLLNGAAGAPRFEVLNFGVSGYSTQQEVELFRTRAAGYRPDLVIVGYCLNDARESSIEGDVFKRLYFDLWSHSYLWEEVELRLGHLAQEWFGYEPNVYQTQVDVRRQFELLEQHSPGCERLVVVFPVLQWGADGYLYGAQHGAVAQALSGLDYELVDLLEPYRRHAPAELRQLDVDTTHPNALGTRIAAEAVFAKLVQARMVPLGAAAGAGVER